MVCRLTVRCSCPVVVEVVVGRDRVVPFPLYYTAASNFPGSGFFPSNPANSVKTGEERRGKIQVWC
uniref:Uncharacterized protein n=1 Tax=Anopheles stephensi TaxID=30069 RepID=A0A182YNE3_ANOST